jgi:hypothetical protein
MPFNIDLHTHSFFSGDGVSSPEDLIASAQAKGLHGIAITDHNTCDAIDYLRGKKLIRDDGLPVNGFLVIPGVEVTTAEGHLLCIGTILPEAAKLKGRRRHYFAPLQHLRVSLCAIARFTDDRGKRRSSCRCRRNCLYHFELRRTFS